MNNLYQVIYYGDSQTEVGKPFAISCIISIADPVEWHKDGEPLRKHSNIRHGKDEHSYIESEMGIAGNVDELQQGGGSFWRIRTVALACGLQESRIAEIL